MAVFSPKIEIINHFDNLINRVDIDIDECLEKYNKNKDQVLGDLKCFKFIKRKLKSLEFIPSWFETDVIYPPFETVANLWSESTKVVDYLKQMRMRTIEELRKAQEDSLDYINLNRSQFRTIETMNRDELISRLFPHKFYFQLHCKLPDDETWIFKLYTLVTDFYMSQFEIDLLEKFINEKRESEIIEHFIRSKPNLVFEKVLLIHLLYGYFCRNLTSQTFPTHVIRVQKQELFNFKEIHIQNDLVNRVIWTGSLVDLSKIEQLRFRDFFEEVNLERLSLKSLGFFYRHEQMDRVSLGNLNSLLELGISADRVDLELQTKILDNCPNIEQLGLTGNKLYNFNLDSLIYLREFSLHGYIEEDFNFDIFNETICNRLEKLSIGIENTNIDNGNLTKLFKHHHFPNILDLSIKFSETDRAEKKLFDRFANLHTLNLNHGFHIIDTDIFSNLKHLVNLEMSDGFIESLNQTFFSQLTKLESLKIRSNGILSIEENTFLHLKNLHSFTFHHNHMARLNAKSFAGLDKDKLKFFSFILNKLNGSYINQNLDKIHSSYRFN